MSATGGPELVEDLTAAIAAATGEVDEVRRRIAVGLYDLLAQGDPVPEVELAARTGLDPELVAARLQRWTNVFRDRRERITGYGGLSLFEMGHSFHAQGGRPIYAWCALDPFLVVPLIGRSARVESRDPTSGKPVTMTVTPSGIEDLQPSSAVVSILRPDRGFGADVIQSFCHFVLNFASATSAESWASERADIVILPTAEAFGVGLRAWSKFRPPGNDLRAAPPAQPGPPAAPSAAG
jgi:alkylmercury lyase